MRYLNPVARMLVALAALTPFAMFCATSNLSVIGYDTVSEIRVTRSQWAFTFKAKLQNTGPALSAVTGVVTSNSPTVQVAPGQGPVHFGAVAANGQVTS